MQVWGHIKCVCVKSVCLLRLTKMAIFFTYNGAQSFLFNFRLFFWGGGLRLSLSLDQIEHGSAHDVCTMNDHSSSQDTSKTHQHNIFWCVCIPLTHWRQAKMMVDEIHSHPDQDFVVLVCVVFAVSAWEIELHGMETNINGQIKDTEV